MSSRHGREGELSRAVRVPEERLGEYWSWLAVALFLLVSVDLLTSLGAAASVGIDVESNPVMAWLLTRSPAALVAVHVAAVVVAAAFFHALIERCAPLGRPLARDGPRDRCVARTSPRGRLRRLREQPLGDRPRGEPALTGRGRSGGS